MNDRDETPGKRRNLDRAMRPLRARKRGEKARREEAQKHELPGRAGQVCQEADILCEAGDLSSAKKALEEFLAERDNPVVWKKYAYVLLRVGEPIAARAVMRSVVQRQGDAHIVDLILAAVPRVKPLIDDTHRIMYFGIPKCGSSSLKDVFVHLRQGELKGGRSHAHTHDMLTAVPLADLTTKYSDYFKVAVVRHPVARLRSFYRRNIVEVGALRKEANGKAERDGLAAAPSYDEVLDRFAGYRASFRGFRHHTDSLIGFLGRDPDRFNMIESMGALNVCLRN
jgi:Sulfotransferase family